MKGRSDGWQGTVALFAVVDVSRHPLFHVGPPVGLEGLSEGISFSRGVLGPTASCMWEKHESCASGSGLVELLVGLVFAILGFLHMVVVTRLTVVTLYLSCHSIISGRC